MSDSRKRRGRQTEKIVAHYLSDIWPHAEAVGSGTPGTDVTGTPGITWEIKARRGFNVQAAMRQALQREGDYHPVVMRPDGAGPLTVGDWPAILPLRELVDLLEAAGYGGAAEGGPTVTVSHDQLRDMVEELMHRVLNEENDAQPGS